MRQALVSIVGILLVIGEPLGWGKRQLPSSILVLDFLITGLGFKPRFYSIEILRSTLSIIGVVNIFPIVLWPVLL